MMKLIVTIVMDHTLQVDVDDADYNYYSIMLALLWLSRQTGETHRDLWLL